MGFLFFCMRLILRRERERNKASPNEIPQSFKSSRSTMHPGIIQLKQNYLFLKTITNWGRDGDGRRGGGMCDTLGSNTSNTFVTYEIVINCS